MIPTPDIKAADRLAKLIGQKMNATEPTSAALGLHYIDGGEAWAKASMVVTHDMLNGHGNLHGGMIFLLADTTFAYACNARNDKSVAQHASIAFLSPGQLGETLTALCREDGRAGRSGVYSVTVEGGDGRIIAQFQGLSRTVRGTSLQDQKDV